MYKEEIKKYFSYVCDDVAQMIGITKNQGEILVRKSYFPKALGKAPDYVIHYDTRYWAKEIVEKKL